MPSDPPRTCRECGAELPAETAPGQCPNCLLGLGLAAAEGEDGGQRTEDSRQKSEVNHQPDANDPPLVTRHSSLVTQFGDYELLEEIGHGGMGVVYKARQKSLDRIVAVKLLLFGPHAPPESVKRFRAEAVATAALQHPNIVAIHEVGVHQGQHFLVMDFVEGRSLATVISNFKFQISDFRRAAGYLKTIAEAIHYAHERGLLHRDLKPSNILIDANDQPRVTDFGLAKRLEGDSELTVSGQVLGSPNYMPPEQATGKRGTVSRRSDVYALGAILYHALTGRPPFVGEGLADTVQQVLNVEPVSPRVLNLRLPADLETVCLKCLEKEPAKRYATAQLLAEELGRFLEGKPVLARPVSRMAKGGRWCRRNPRLAMATGAVLLSLLIGLAGVTWQWRRAESQRARAELNLYAADISGAYHYLRDGYSSQALDLLGRHGPAGQSEIRDQTRPSPLAPDLRCWEWRYLWGQARSEVELVLDRMPSQCRLDLSADGRFLAVASRHGSLHLWDLTARRLVASLGREFPANTGYASVSADGRFLAFLESGESQPLKVVLWDVNARARRAELVSTNFAVLLPFAFVPGSPTVVVGRIATSDRARSLALWNFQTGQIAATYAISKDPLQRYGSLDFPFTADGSRFVCGEVDGRIRIFDSRTLELRDEFAAHENAISGLALSPDGKTLATAQAQGSTRIQLWDFETRQPLAALAGHARCVTALGFSPNGRLLVSGSADHTVRVWDRVTGKEVRRLLGHKGEIICVRFSPDEQRLYSSDMDGSVCVWGLEGNPRRMSPEQRAVRLDDLSLSPDGKRLATVNRDGVACIYEVASGKVLDGLPGLGNNNRGVLFAADGRLLFVAKRSGDLFVWNQPEQRVVRKLAEEVDVWWAETSQDGRLVVAIDESARIHVWHTDTWQARVWEAAWQPDVAPSPPAALSLDGQRLVVGLGGGIVRVLDPRTGSLVRVLKHGERAIRRVAFSADGRLLAASSLDASVIVWETSAWHETVRLSLPNWADSLGFSPDGRRLAIGNRAQEAVKLWDTATWRELLTLEAPGGVLWHLAFTADGSRLLGCNEAGDLLIWSAPSSTEMPAVEGRQSSP